MYLYLFYLGGLIMGKKIPMWQCLLIMVVLVALLYWGIMIDTDAAEGHVALILAGGFAAIIAIINGWKWSYLEAGILAAINRTMQAISLIDKSMKNLMQKASASKPMFEYFLFLAEQVLHDPNSPLRDDER
ncbi:MAG: DUF5106 domain-containing protein, partial [Firmicutes bacterium]|nr:DUF5106 domain-containing protein [Bacillota bacterium]